MKPSLLREFRSKKKFFRQIERYGFVPAVRALSHSLSSPERRSSNCVQKEVAVGFPDVGMTRPGLSRDTHLFNPTWPPRMWSQQLVVIVKARAEASSPGRASKSESELLNWTSSTRESCSPSLPFMGWDCPTLFLVVWLCWLLSSSWKSPPRLQFHVCVHEPIQAIVRSRFCTLFPISLDILLSSLPSSQRNGLVPRVT